MANNVIEIPLTSSAPHCARIESAADALLSCAVDLLDLARITCGEPPNSSFVGYCWMAGQLQALYEHNETGAVAAFEYDSRSRQLIYFCGSNY
jgi:hypothetical protein